MNKRKSLFGLLLLVILSAGAYFAVVFYPDGRPDSVRLMTLLHNQNYGKLNKMLLKREAAYEANIIEEIDFSLAVEAFANADPEHEALLSEWIARYPDSYLPYLVRGVYYSHLGYTWRGTEASSKTSTEQFAKMASYHEKAYRDLEKSIQLKPTTLAYSTLIDLSSSSRGGKSREDVLIDGLALEPASYVIRKSYLFKLMPRWRGSYEQIDAFLEDTRLYVETNPALNPLLGFKDYVIGYNLQSSGQFEEALEHYTQALSFGEKEWILKQRGTTYLQLQDYEKALKDLDRAIALWPHFQSALTWRGIVYEESGQIDAALADFNLASKLEPYDFVAHKNRGGVYVELKKYPEAVEDYRRALYYEKNHGDIWHTLGWVFSYKLKDYKEAAKAYETAANQRPGNPDYWYEYAIALFNLNDCQVIPILDRYLSSCGSTSAGKCGEKFQSWAKEVTEHLISSNKCPVSDEAEPVVNEAANTSTEPGQREIGLAENPSKAIR